MGVTISCDIEADPSMTATEGVDFTPTIAEALAAVVLPAGVTRVGNRFSWTPPSSPSASIPQFLIKFNRVDDALIEAVEKIALRLTNPTITGAGASTLGLSMPSASINIIENKVSTVPPTHTSGDVMYPEPDPLNPGEFSAGPDLALSRQHGAGVVAVRQQLPRGHGNLQSSSAWPPVLSMPSRP